MTANDIEVVAAFVGLASTIAFSQTSRHLIIGWLSRLVAVISLPLGAAFIWRLALEFHWWTILVFVVVSMFTGAFNALYARAAGRSFLYSVQPFQAALIVMATIGCWVPSAVHS